MKYVLSCLTVMVLSAAVPTTTSRGYTITGTVTGLPDSTWLYLRISNDNCIDSCRVLHGTFNMKGRIAEKAMPVILHTEKYTHYLGFWLENNRIKITAKAGEFNKATITGSASQNEKSRLDSLRAQKKQTYRNYVRTHPSSIIAIYLLHVYASDWGRDTASAMFNKFSTEMKATQYGRNVSEFIALNRNVKLGDKYVDFEQPNTEGKMVKLSQVKGKYILLDFWASWCGPCLEENPRLVATYARFKDKGFAILGVSLDNNKASWLKIVADHTLTWENVSELRGNRNTAALIYGIDAVPTNFLIDENGIIIAKNLRGKKLDEKLEQLLP